MQAFLGNSDQRMSAHCNPNLCRHRVLAGAVESFDSQMLLDPFEEQLYLPALDVSRCDQFVFKSESVGKKADSFVSLVFDHCPAQYLWIVFVRTEHQPYARLIAHHVDRGSFHRVGITPIELHMAFRGCYKAGLLLMDQVQTLEVQEPVQPRRCLGAVKKRLRKYRQTQIIGRRIEGVQGCIQLDIQRYTCVQSAGNTNQVLSQVCED